MLDASHIMSRTLKTPHFRLVDELALTVQPWLLMTLPSYAKLLST